MKLVITLTGLIFDNKSYFFEQAKTYKICVN